MRKIDCHTHIINEKMRDEYFSRTDSTALVMQFPDSILQNPETVRTVCRAIAALRGLTEEEIARETWQNACRVLRLPDKFAKAPFGV